MAALEVAHERLHKKNERLSAALDKFKSRGKGFAKAMFHGGEVMAGAAIAGMIQGSHVAKDANDKGAKVAGIPTDLLIGSGLTVLGATGTLDEYSSHVSALGLGFMAGFAAEWGYHRGQQKAATGHWFQQHGAAASLPAGRAPAAAPKAAGEFNPHELAASLVESRRAAMQG